MDTVVPWPPAAFAYKTTLDLQGVPQFSYELSFTAQVDPVNLNNVIVGRIGGPDEADAEFRRQLYGVVGASVVAGGRVEAAMKRLIIVLTSAPNSFASVDLNWTQLVTKVKGEADREVDDDSAPLRLRIRELVASAERRHLKEMRDHIVHGFFWDFTMPRVLLSRFKRRDDGATYIFTIQKLQAISVDLLEYADALESSLHGVWPQVMLPAATDASEPPGTPDGE